MSSRVWVHHFLGAFGDAGILFPILAALSMKAGFSGPVLLASAGAAYWASGLFFKVPISVQPLKSIAIAAVAMGATFQEVRVSGFVLALFCLFISFLDVQTLARRIPFSLIHGIQASLGILLILQGAKIGFGTPTHWIQGVMAAGLCGILFFAPSFAGVTALGLLATGGMIWAMLSSWNTVNVGLPALHLQMDELRFGVLATLIFPQLALTLANSVVSTQDVCGKYFGEKASRVTIRNLLRSIGMGNVLTALVGGLPYCHGAGGVTAHYRAGARHWISNGILGTVLIALGVLQWAHGRGGAIQFNPVILASLLAATGLFHMSLAAPTWSRPGGRIKLIAMGLMVTITQNILWALAAGLLAEILIGKFQKKEVANDTI